jgi:hypothetical protein
MTEMIARRIITDGERNVIQADRDRRAAGNSFIRPISSRGFPFW